MAGSERQELIRELRDSVEDRREFADDYVNTTIALQIKALRQQRGWTQEELAQRAGKGQSQISQYENVNNDAWTVKTLRALAEAFELPLIIRFESWGFLVGDSCRLSRRYLERPAIEDDPAFREQPAERASADSLVSFEQFADRQYQRVRLGTEGGPLAEATGG